MYSVNDAIGLLSCDVIGCDRFVVVAASVPWRLGLRQISVKK